MTTKRTEYKTVKVKKQTLARGRQRWLVRPILGVSKKGSPFHTVSEQDDTVPWTLIKGGFLADVQKRFPPDRFEIKSLHGADFPVRMKVKEGT